MKYIIDLRINIVFAVIVSLFSWNEYKGNYVY